ncbi:hypothetical protein AB0C70_27115 [Streptomyces sp. NPDC048564]|uniref:hypothetical protein n=1 Tax=Streptomyces sp. NPDC048564 TaxID=3155760 RepID=UPI0034203EDA
MRVRHALWLQRIDHKIAAHQKRQTEQDHRRRSRPRPPERIVELGIGDGRPPIEVHADDCGRPGWPGNARGTVLGDGAYLKAVAHMHNLALTS